MVEAGRFWFRLGLNTDDLKIGIDKAKSSMLEWRGETIAGSGEMLKWGAAIGLTAAPLVALGYELVSLTTKAAEFGKAIKDNARDLGLTTDQYQQWTHAAIASGSSAEEITGSIRMLSVRLKDVVDPTSEVSRYLAAMGVSAVDSNGKLRDTNAILLDILPALNALPEGMDRNQASMVLFGRGFENIADLTSLSREELQKLMDQAPVFSDEKIQRMDAMAIEMALLNEQIQIMSVDLGEDLIPLAEDLIKVFEELGPLIKDISGGLHAGATGTVMMGQGLQLLYTQWRYGMDSPEMKALQKEVQDYAQSEYDERSGEGDKHRYSSEEIVTKINNGQTISTSERAWAKKYDPQLYAQIPASTRTGLKVLPKPSTEKDPNAMTQYEIVRTQTDLSTLTEVTIPEQKLELKKLKEDYAAMGDHGSEAAKKIAREIIKLNNDIIENGNRVAEMTEKLTKAGAVVTATRGPTAGSVLGIGTEFASGFDYGGEFEFSSMDATQLQAVIDKASHGGSKSQAEKAQSLLTLMERSKTSSAAIAPTAGTANKTGAITASGAASIDKKTPSLADQAVIDTKTIETELTKQGIAYEGLSVKITNGWGEIEKAGMIHYPALAEMSRVRTQAELDYMVEAVNFGGQNPIIQNKIIISADGPDWTPPKFTAIEAPTLATADFSSIQLLGSAAKKDDSSSSGTTKNITVNQDVTIINNGVKSDAQGVNNALGEIAALGGALP